MMNWLDRIPLLWLVLVAAWLGVAPVVPEPHLIEKLRMLSQGTLARPLDVFDLVLHLRLWRMHRHSTTVHPPGDQPPP